jgi:signal transduction histidine kinase
LNVIEGAIQLAEETGEAEHFERCHRAVDRMDTLIGDLLSSARAGAIIEDTEPVPLASLVEKCWQGVDLRQGTLQLALDTTTVIHVDESRLTQLLENLIRNAFDHGSDDTTVTVGRLAEGFYVEDDGLGIPTDDREKVFESGYSTLEGGTGFGLAIVQEIVEAHGWRVRVHDAEAGGARFEITGIKDV